MNEELVFTSSEIQIAVGCSESFLKDLARRKKMRGQSTKSEEVEPVIEPTYRGGGSGKRDFYTFSDALKVYLLFLASNIGLSRSFAKSLKKLTENYQRNNPATLVNNLRGSGLILGEGIDKKDDVKNPDPFSPFWHVKEPREIPKLEKCQDHKIVIKSNDQITMVEWIISPIEGQESSFVRAVGPWSFPDLKVLKSNEFKIKNAHSEVVFKVTAAHIHMKTKLIGMGREYHEVKLG